MTSFLKKSARTFLLLATVFQIASCGSSRRTVSIEEGWEILGESKANFVRDRDEIAVLSANRFTAIRFKVEDKNIHLNDLHIVYQSGDKLNPVMDEELVANQYSRNIELGPEGKSIRSIDFAYRTRGNVLKGRAKVLVFGKRYVAPVINPAPVSQ
ncbi:MAG: hypothetical protein H7X88_10760 [Gloeobacteraceae cyanobacterium ES-bin-316]|nr:hypothetical protein [Ferruginibacter sp.]